VVVNGHHADGGRHCRMLLQFGAGDNTSFG